MMEAPVATELASMTPETSTLDSPVPLESILCTDELQRRPSRAADYEKENRALVSLAQALADSPRTILQTLADTILDVFEAHSAGISLLTTNDGGKRFYWPAIAGLWKEHIGGGTPRDFGPCGDVLDQNAPLMFRHVERRYTYFAPVTPLIEECLLLPFYVKGKAVGTIWAIAHDESRKFDAEDLRLLESVGRFAAAAYEVSAALDSLGQLAAIVESSDDAIMSKDLNGIIQTWNAGAEKLYGYTAQEAIGQSVTMLFPPDRLDEETDILERIRRGERINNYETIRRCKDGALRNISLTISPIIGAQGQIIGASKIVRDISERKRAEAEREKLLVSELEARQQAESANRVKDEFLATISHELRTPLNAIIGWTSILTGGRLDEQSTARGLATIARNAKLQNELISDLLDVSRIITGQLRLETGVVDLLPVINTAAESISPAAEKKEVELRLMLDPTAGMVSGDPERLQQVFSNLLTNAIKFTSRGGRVDVQLKREDTSVVIDISDTGEGIDPEFLPHIFDRFRQAEGCTSRQHTGLGLGLAIARHLVEAHGGVVAAASDGIGKGATFTLRFPLIAVNRIHSKTAKAGDDEGATDSPLSELVLEGLRVLVVDDQPDARELLTIALTQIGCDVKTSATVGEALGIMDQWKPDVLVSDIGMPGEDGYELMRKVRARPPERGGLVPALAVTGYASPEDAARARAVGYHMHMAKPVSPRKLVAMVASLAMRSSASEAARPPAVFAGSTAS